MKSFHLLFASIFFCFFTVAPVLADTGDSCPEHTPEEIALQLADADEVLRPLLCAFYIAAVACWDYGLTPNEKTTIDLAAYGIAALYCTSLHAGPGVKKQFEDTTSSITPPK